MVELLREAIDTLKPAFKWLGFLGVAAVCLWCFPHDNLTGFLIALLAPIFYLARIRVVAWTADEERELALLWRLEMDLRGS
jgi:hypothetical protein